MANYGLILAAVGAGAAGYLVYRYYRYSRTGTTITCPDGYHWNGSQCIQNPPPDSYTLTLGMKIFGYPSYFNPQNPIAEFKNFVENNSKLRLNLLQDQYTAISETEFILDANSGNWYLGTLGLSADTVSKLTPFKFNLVLYDTQTKTPAYGGVTIGQGPFQMENGFWPLCTLPFGENIQWWMNPEPGWSYGLSSGMVHEFQHAIVDILNNRGYYGLPNIDKATDYGYTSENDPGWVNFRKWFFTNITDEMYEALTR